MKDQNQTILLKPNDSSRTSDLITTSPPLGGRKSQFINSKMSFSQFTLKWQRFFFFFLNCKTSKWKQKAIKRVVISINPIHLNVSLIRSYGYPSMIVQIMTTYNLDLEIGQINLCTSPILGKEEIMCFLYICRTIKSFNKGQFCTCYGEWVTVWRGRERSV